MPSNKQAPNTPQNPEGLEYYSYLLINKTKRLGLFLLLGLTFALVMGVITSHIMSGHKSWLYLAPLTILLGLPLMAFPPVEKWIYKPWQSKAQKYERHYRD